MAEERPDLIEQVQEDVQERLDEPAMYRVLLYNDDFTTREFVVQILVAVFHKSLPAATELMWRIHRSGRGVAGIFSRDVAETKVVTVRTIAREHEFPLKVEMEPDT